jgi:hypothetical protein
LKASLAEKVLPQFLRGDHDVGVFQAFKEVEVAVRKAANKKGAGYPDDLVGTTLMRRAFDQQNGPLINMSLVSAERDAEAHLFAGAIGHAKNPPSHRDVTLSPQEAARRWASWAATIKVRTAAAVAEEGSTTPASAR